MTFNRLLIVLAAIFLITQANAQTRDEMIAERLSPVGEVCMAGEPCASGAGAGAESGSSNDPETVYNTFCGTCHNIGLAGAPKFAEAGAWDERLGSKGIDALYANAITGIGGMPPKGTCMNCSDEELNATIDYMIEKSQ